MNTISSQSKTFKTSITKEEIAELPIEEFNGQIEIVQTIEEAKKALEILKEQKLLGFDSETKPSFVKGKINNVCLIQLSTLSTCYLFRINMADMLSDIISEIMENENIMKIGLSLKDDFSGINKLQNFSPNNFIDLQKYVKQFGITDNSLSKIYAIVFNKKISKSQRLTNWEAETLTDKQMKYAALDAWAALVIYQQLKNEVK
ncbi:MAG: 3'-5' exonuclease [Paludibacteraceae bacterium]|jgi:ribonuclease D|nr:3'-5' exonuclease domain-containing protein 2 [Paludibacteraceae bacterium]MEE0910969.1 3'-5' exonuclease [Paludibacteraceae bacterium]